MITITCRDCGASFGHEDVTIAMEWSRDHRSPCTGKTDVMLHASYQSVYEEDSRTAFDLEGRPDEVEALRQVAAIGVDFALEELVRRDAFSERTLAILDEMRGQLVRGEYVTGLSA